MAEYVSSLNAELYQALHTGTFGDWQFYKSLVESKLSSQKRLKVLELGCGSGRILLELASLKATPHIELTGLELNSDLLNICKEKVIQYSNVSLIEGDFSKLEQLFPQTQKFDLILLPYNGIYCLQDEEAQVKLLHDVAQLLAPKGECWFDGYALPDPDEYDYDSAEDFSPLTVIELPASLKRKERVLGVEELDHFDKEKQRFTVKYRYCAPEEEQELEPFHHLIECIEHRYLYPWQLPNLCQKAQVHFLSLTADFGGEAISTQSEIRQAIEWGIEAEHWIACITANQEQKVK